MGACNFIEFGKGDTAREAFEELVWQAEYDHGHDPYSGTIATTNLAGIDGKVADEWSDDARRLAYELAEMNDWGEKRESRAIDCGKHGSTRVWAFYGWAAC